MLEPGTKHNTEKRKHMKTIILIGSAALTIGVTTGGSTRAAAASSRTAAVFRRQPARPADQSRRRRQIRRRCRPTSRSTARSTRPKAARTIRSATSSSCPTAALAQNVQTNNAWVSFVNHDGSVHTSRWIGVQNPGEQRSNLKPPLVLNEPLGSDIANGVLYMADRDGGTTPTDPAVSVVRKFNMKTGAPAGEIRVPSRPASTTSKSPTTARSTRRRPALAGRIPIRRPGRSGRSRATATPSIFVQGAPLRQPNGIAFDPQGNIVVINIGNNEVLTFSPAGKLLKTENAVQPGNDGLVIMKDGTKYVSSVVNGGVSRIRPGRPAELIAQNIPNPASMCYDAGANQLVIPMNANNGWRSSRSN